MIGLETVMFLAFSHLAYAVEPIPIQGIDCQRPVHFEAPYRWEWSADKPLVVDVTALVVRGSADLLRTRNVGQQVLFVEGWPAEVLWQAGDTALVLAPLSLPAGGARVWFGDTVLPETIDADHRRASLGHVPASALHVPWKQTDTLVWPAGARRRDLVTTLRGWMEQCGGPPR